MKQIYLRYLVLAEALRKSNLDLSGIDEVGKKLLKPLQSAAHRAIPWLLLRPWSWLRLPAPPPFTGALKF